jgi:hypothetical protein
LSRAKLAGFFSVDDAARRIRHYRYVEERLMRVMGGWIALTPELPAKLIFGRHVWDCAQHADLWGRRLPELRAPAQQSEPANDGVVKLMEAFESVEGPRQTLERLTGVYRVVKPHLVTVYARHLESTNPVYEPPTRRILERCLGEERRHAASGVIVLDRLTRDADARARVADWERRLSDSLASAGGITGDVAGPLIDPGLLGAPRDAIAADLVETPPDFDAAAALPADLAAAVDAHRKAIEAGDTRAAGEWIDPAARERVLEAYARLGEPVRDSRVVGLAAIGGERIVKVRLQGARTVGFVQLRWTPSRAGWRVADADLVASEPVTPR